MDNKLTFECNTNYIVKKCHQRSFGVSPKTLHMFYCSFIENVLTSCLVCWFGILRVKNRGKLNSIASRGGRIVEVRHTEISQVYETR